MSRNCTRKVFCYRCRTQNKHNTALCTEGIGSETTSVTVTGNDQSILLQTACGYVTDEKEKKVEGNVIQIR